MDDTGPLPQSESDTCLGSMSVSQPLSARLPASLVPNFTASAPAIASHTIRAVERSMVGQHALQKSLASSQSRKKKGKENEQTDETQPQRKKRRIDEEVC